MTLEDAQKIIDITADFIAGMTNRYAVARHREVVGPMEMPEGI